MLTLWLIDNAVFFVVLLGKSSLCNNLKPAFLSTKSVLEGHAYNIKSFTVYAYGFPAYYINKQDEKIWNLNLIYMIYRRDHPVIF